MSQADAPSLAHRLRELREREWPDARITQRQLAEALGLSESLISSWESDKTKPPYNRIDAYASFFASRRSVDGSARILPDDELTPEESHRRDALRDELRTLRDFEDQSARSEVHSETAPIKGTWYFADQQPVVIACVRLPQDILSKMPFVNASDPDYERMYRFADLDALFELWGHLRAANPTTLVKFKAADRLTSDDYAKHLVVLGGIDWNYVTRDLMSQLRVPLKQIRRTGDDVGGFVDTENGEEFHPTVVAEESGLRLVEDVAHFLRAPNPYNAARTVSICNGMFGRGTYAAVRSLTDTRFRDRNEGFLRREFGGGEVTSIVSRVRITPTGETITPDWNVAAMRLHSWPRLGTPA